MPAFRLAGPSSAGPSRAGPSSSSRLGPSGLHSSSPSTSPSSSSSNHTNTPPSTAENSTPSSPTRPNGPLSNVNTDANKTDVVTAFAMMDLGTARSATCVEAAAGGSAGDGSAMPAARRLNNVVRKTLTVPPSTNHSGCNCESFFKAVVTDCLLPLPDLPQAIVDVWAVSEHAWRPTGGYLLELPWDMVQSMYDAQLTNPIAPEIMDSFSEVINDFTDRDILILDSSFYGLLGSACHCHKGLCKDKAIANLERALKLAGHEGVKLYNYDRVFFTAKANGFWLAFMLDAKSKRNLMYDPCGMFHADVKLLDAIVHHIEYIIAAEASQAPPGTETVFDKSVFRYVSPTKPIDPRFGSILVLGALEIFAQLGVPEDLDTLTFAFACLSSLVGSGTQDAWDMAVKKQFALANHRGQCGNGPVLVNKPKAKTKKSKNLKSRIADANKPKTSTTRKTAVVPPASIPRKNSSENADEPNDLAAALVSFLVKMKDQLDSAPVPDKHRKKGPKITTNAVEKVLLDRILWTVGMGVPPHFPKNFVSCVQKEMEGKKEGADDQGAPHGDGKAKGKGKAV